MDAEARFAALTIFFTLFAVKMTTALIVLFYIPTPDVVIQFMLLNWFWFIPPLILLVGGATYWLRMLRARARRRELLRQEFTRGPAERKPSRLAFLLRRPRPQGTPRVEYLS